jgi:hypothetical protein
MLWFLRVVGFKKIKEISTSHMSANNWLGEDNIILSSLSLSHTVTRVTIPHPAFSLFSPHTVTRVTLPHPAFSLFSPHFLTHASPAPFPFSSSFLSFSVSSPTPFPSPLSSSSLRLHHTRTRDIQWGRERDDATRERTGEMDPCDSWGRERDQRPDPHWVSAGGA